MFRSVFGRSPWRRVLFPVTARMGSSYEPLINSPSPTPILPSRSLSLPISKSIYRFVVFSKKSEHCKYILLTLNILLNCNKKILFLVPEIFKQSKLITRMKLMTPHLPSHSINITITKKRTEVNEN